MILKACLTAAPADRTNRSQLYELIATGKIEAIKLGSATLVLTESLRTLVEAERNAAPN